MTDKFTVPVLVTGKQHTSEGAGCIMQLRNWMHGQVLNVSDRVPTTHHLLNSLLVNFNDNMCSDTKPIRLATGKLAYQLCPKCTKDLLRWSEAMDFTRHMSDAQIHWILDPLDLQGFGQHAVKTPVGRLKMDKLAAMVLMWKKGKPVETHQPEFSLATAVERRDKAAKTGQRQLAMAKAAVGVVAFSNAPKPDEQKHFALVQ